jgi:hypothetical protein
MASLVGDCGVNAESYVATVGASIVARRLVLVRCVSRCSGLELGVRQSDATDPVRIDSQRQIL